MPSARFFSRAVAGRKIVGLVLTAFLPFVGLTAQSSSKSGATAKKKSAAASTAKRNSAKSVTTSSPKSSGRARSGGGKVVVARKLVHGHWVRTTQIVHTDPAPTFQTHPDTERYQQIQQALAQKGYFKGEANGQWNADSVAALTQFQTDQKINNDGKISSLSLIGLGLGPNRETPTTKADAPGQR